MLSHSRSRKWRSGFRPWKKDWAPLSIAQRLSSSVSHSYYCDPRSSNAAAPLLQPLYVSDTSCLHWQLFSALKIPFYMFQEPSSHPLSRWQTLDEGNGVLESLFLACFSAACWNLEAGWVLHRQGSVAQQKPFNSSLEFPSMPSLSSDKFVLNLLAGSAFQGTLYTIYSLQSCRKPIKGQWKEVLNNTIMDNQSLSFNYIQSRCYSDKQMPKKNVGDRFLSSWSLLSTADALKHDRNRVVYVITFSMDHHPAMNYFQATTVLDKTSARPSWGRSRKGEERKCNSTEHFPGWGRALQIQHFKGTDKSSKRILGNYAEHSLVLWRFILKRCTFHCRKINTIQRHYVLQCHYCTRFSSGIDYVLKAMVSMKNRSCTKNKQRKHPSLLSFYIDYNLIRGYLHSHFNQKSSNIMKKIYHSLMGYFKNQIISIRKWTDFYHVHHHFHFPYKVHIVRKSSSNSLWHRDIKEMH